MSGTGRPRSMAEMFERQGRAWSADDRVTNGATTTTTYLNDPLTGAMSEAVVSAATTQWHDYVMAGRSIVAERFCTGAAPCAAGATMLYFTGDQLGSTSALTDQTGALVERDSYDAWGKRRNANGTDDPSCSLTSATTRGFTAQEHIDSLCAINFNARIYDPVIGRFVSADAQVPHALNGQSFNRYSYVDNRVLSATDPTGHDDCGGDGSGGYGGGGCVSLDPGDVFSILGTTPPPPPDPCSSGAIECVTVTGPQFKCPLCDALDQINQINASTALASLQSWANSFLFGLGPFMANVAPVNIAAPPSKTPVPKACHASGFSFGVTAGGSGEAGFPGVGGIGGQLSGAAGVSVNAGKGNQTSVGATTTEGGTAQGTSNLNPFSGAGNFTGVFGAFLGGGVGLFWSNVGNMNALSGPFDTLSINVGEGLGLSLVWASSGDTQFISVTGGPGTVASYSNYQTTSKTASSASCN